MPLLTPIIRRNALLGLVSVLSLFVVPTLAQEADDENWKPPFPTTEFGETDKEASVTVGDLRATVTLVQARNDGWADADSRLRVSVAGKQVLETTTGPTFANVPATEASIAEIDPANKHPEVYFTAYTGGAHCCTSVVIATETPSGWTAVTIGEFDGDGYYLDDLDKDGDAEIVTNDNRFLYQFDCYACSAAPLQITTIRNGATVDVTRDPAYGAAHRDWLEDIEGRVGAEERWTSPGFLAGWVAQKALVGEFEAAWSELVAQWDWASDEGEEVCLSGVDLEACAKFDRALLKFPERLARFLEETGYTR